MAKATGLTIKIEFNSTDYISAHGKQPRGEGNWAFATSPDMPGTNPNVFWHRGTLAEAKQAARAHFTAEKIRKSPFSVGYFVVEVYVLS